MRPQTRTLLLAAVFAVAGLPLAAEVTEDLARFAQDVEALRALRFERPVEH